MARRFTDYLMDEWSKTARSGDYLGFASPPGGQDAIAGPIYTNAPTAAVSATGIPVRSGAQRPPMYYGSLGGAGVPVRPVDETRRRMAELDYRSRPMTLQARDRERAAVDAAYREAAEADLAHRRAMELEGESARVAGEAANKTASIREAGETSRAQDKAWWDMDAKAEEIALETEKSIAVEREKAKLKSRQSGEEYGRELMKSIIRTGMEMAAAGETARAEALIEAGYKEVETERVTERNKDQEPSAWEKTTTKVPITPAAAPTEGDQNGNQVPDQTEARYRRALEAVRAFKSLETPTGEQEANFRRAQMFVQEMEKQYKQLIAGQ